MPEFGTQQVPQRRLGCGAPPPGSERGAPAGRAGAEARARRREAAAEPDWEVWKTATWFLLTRPHAHLVAAYPHKFLLGIADEYYISTLLRTLGRAGETTCDWAGPTYTNWTDPVDPDMDGQSHPRTFHALDGGLLQRMRRSSSFRGVACDWAAGAAAVEWQFSSLLEWTVDAWPPDYAAMPETCPLLARKFAADATPSVIAALWPEAPAPDACAPPRLPRV